MKGIITVVGKDRVGIIAPICVTLANRQANILDLSQTIVDEFFNMVMITDLSNIQCEFHELREELERVGESVGVIIRLQHEGIFNSMHRL